ncbi:sugar ABC transporter substrate-binding protein [Carboxydochorda subterranea]|uniref:Sugar ABC transporter substrate-binding protein n=1 Tax=Carboxydichorda subterranea TaxID=3109565 RepID=A0ABZ1C1C2_9FIRM|nr:sugar ABC transporter substrate-binding protein [Limnochorda sp. L945t]WRP18734.1 sugar ABC transporter substrate-binding protein [Limnochorda sp. L945t]
MRHTRVYRLLAAAIALAAMVVTLPAAAETGVKGRLSVMIYKDNPGQDVPTRQQILEWAAQNNVEVSIEPVVLKDLAPKVATTLASGTGPDVLILPGYSPRLYVDALLDLSDVGNEVDRKYGFYDIAKLIGKVNDRWVALPVYIYMHQLVYRKDVLKAVGETVPDTWDDLVRVGQKIKSAKLGVDAFGVAYGRSDDGNQFVQGVLWAYGSRMVTEDEKRVTFDSPETVAGLRYVVGLYQQGLMPPGVLAWDDSSNNKEILAGRIAMTVNGGSIYFQAKTAFPDIFPNLGLAVYPRGPVMRASMPNAFSWAVRKNTAYPELAKSLLRYLFSAENYMEVINTTSGAIGTSLKWFENATVWQDPDTRAALQAIPTAHMTGWPAPPSKRAAEVEARRLMVDMVGRVLIDKLTPEAAVKEAAAAIAEIYRGQ